MVWDKGIIYIACHGGYTVLRGYLGCSQRGIRVYMVSKRYHFGDGIKNSSTE